MEGKGKTGGRQGTVTFRWESSKAVAPLRPEREHLESGMNAAILVGAKLFWIGSLGRLWGGRVSVGICDLIKGRWDWIGRTSDDDPYVNGHVCFLADEGIYLHGGRYKSFMENTKLYRFDVTLLEWTVVYVRGAIPPTRYYHAGEFLERAREFMCLGGATSNRGVDLVELWVFNVDSRAWRVPKTKGFGPQPRRGMASCVVGDRVLYYGGRLRNGQTTVSEMNILDCRDGRFHWETVVMQDSLFLSFASLCYVDGLLVLFGGDDSNQHTENGVYVCRPPQYKLKRLGHDSPTCRLENENMPSYGHSAVVLAGDMYVLDGVGGNRSIRRLRKELVRV